MVNHYDFEGVDIPEQAWEILCEQIRKGCSDDSKIVVVTGLGEVPKCWRNASNVITQGSGKAGELLLGSRSHFMKKKMAQAEQEKAEDKAIAPAKIMNETQLQMEAIPNLTLGEAEAMIQVAKRRTSSGNLTRVTGFKGLKLRMGSFFRWLFS